MNRGFTLHHQKAIQLFQRKGGINPWMKGENIPKGITPKPRLLSRGAGFTLIEILISISIVGLMFTVAIPVSYSMYKAYKESLEAEKVLMLVSSLRRESFLHSKETILDAKEGRLVVDGTVKDDFKDIFIHTERSIVFYRNGTTSGGRIVLNTKDNIFYINIDAPFGGLRLTRQMEGQGQRG